MPLNERERAILDFESSCRLRGWAKEEQIRQTLGMSPARYYQLLVRMLRHHEPIEAPETHVEAPPQNKGWWRR